MELELLAQPELAETAAAAKLEAAELLTKSMLLERQLAEGLAEKVGGVEQRDPCGVDGSWMWPRRRPSRRRWAVWMVHGCG